LSKNYKRFRFVVTHSCYNDDDNIQALFTEIGSTDTHIQ